LILSLRGDDQMQRFHAARVISEPRLPKSTIPHVGHAPFATEMPVRCKRARRAPSRPEQSQQSGCYSITSSAIARRLGGIVRPSDFAALRLITNRNLVGCTTGRSIGFVPLRIRPAYMPACRLISAILVP